MSNQSTIYDIGIMYNVNSHGAEAGLKSVGEHAESAGHHVHSLKSELLELGEAVGAVWLLEKGKEMFIEVNNDLEKTVLSMATITRMFNKDMSWDQAQEQAEDFFSFYREAAKKSGSTTMEFAQAHKDIAPAMEEAGASIKDFKEITTGMMVSAKTMGVDQGTAAMSIGKMIHGTVMNRDRYSKALIAMGHMTVADFNAKAKSDPQFALNFMEQTFGSKAMKEARDHLEHSYEGAISTLKSNVEKFMEDATGPLFEGVKDVLNDINVWIATHPQQLKEWAHDITATLKTGFGLMKSAMGFVVEHKDTLIRLAEAFLALKTMGILGGGVMGGIEGFAGSILGLKDASLKSASGIEAFSGNLTTAAGALVGLYLAAQAFADWVDHKHKTNVEKTAEQGAVGALYVARKTAHEMQTATGGDFAKGLNAQGDADAKGALAALVTHVKDWGTYTKDAKVDWEKFSEHVKDLNMDPALAQQLGPMVDEAFKRFAVDGSIWGRLGIQRPEHFDTDENKRKKAQKTAVNVTIHKVEVASPDPDRFAFGLDKAFKKLASNPTAAADALRGGS